MASVVRGGESRARAPDPAASLFTSLTARRRSTGPRPRAPPRQSGAGTVAIPAEFTGDFFGGTMPNTTYFGAADPAGSQVVGGLDQLRHAVIHQ